VEDLFRGHKFKHVTAFNLDEMLPEIYARVLSVSVILLVSTILGQKFDKLRLRKHLGDFRRHPLFSAGWDGC
jgi:hypothetical protein